MLTPEEAATVAIATFTNRPLSTSQSAAADLIATALSSPDPHISDLPGLFTAFQTLYFRSLLPPSVCSVSWSTKMTLCAGTCSLSPPSRSSRRTVAIRLSEPLLRYRPRTDVVNTLLHEGIHAYLFMCSDHRRSDDPSGHGSDFQRIAAAVNEHGGYDISATHEFHDEVESYRTHVWRCNGVCKDRPPWFGEVRRAMDRPPGKGDTWWKEHEETCGGKWRKVAGPKGWGSIEKWVVKKEKDEDHGKGKRKRDEINDNDRRADVNPKKEGKNADTNDTGQKRRRQECDGPPPNDAGTITAAHTKTLVDCPVCPEQVAEEDINSHLDVVHGFGESG